MGNMINGIGKGSIKNLKHTSRGSKPMNLIVAFECAFHMCLLAFAQVRNFKILACVVYASSTHD
jgi:hypothetical protein